MSLKPFGRVPQDGIEQCRKLCGGHGYLCASGLPELYAAYVPACTYEGDNTILLLQVYYLPSCLPIQGDCRSMILSELLLQKDLKTAEKLMVFGLIAQLQTV
jgi:hypothetical protein